MLLGILIVLLPLVLYLSAAFSVKRKNINNPDDYFVAFKKIGVTAFSSSSVAYNFQVSTIYPFLLWGASNIYFIPSINTLCAGFGILIFALCYPKYKHIIGKDITLHGILGENYGNTVRIVASYMTITAFLGFAISETYFGSKVIMSFMPDKNYAYLLITIILLFVYCYIAYGGQLSSIRTDQLQLMISYTGIFGMLLYFLYLVITRLNSIPSILSWELLALCVYMVFVFTLRKFRFIKFSEDDATNDRIINNLLNTLIVVLFILLFLFSLYTFISKKQLPDAKPFFSIEGFGIPGLLSLIILPLTFQFVDLSNWQRLLSVKHEKDSDTTLEKNIRRGLLTYAFESPFTWLIFIIFGLLAINALPKFSFNDLLIDIPHRLLVSKSILEQCFGYVFILSIISIMLSTIDSFLMGIIFTFVYDSNPKTRKIMDSNDPQEKIMNNKYLIKTGKIFGLIAIIIGIILFITFDKSIPNGGEMFINLLLAFYSAQLGFLPHILGILFLKKRPSSAWAIASMITGSASGLFIGIYAVILRPEWAWYPVLICLVLSFTIYLSGFFFAKK
jgi:hypothetical protein